MKFIPIIIIAVLLLSCCNGKGGKNNEPYDGGHGIGIDTATIHQIDSIDEEPGEPYVTLFSDGEIETDENGAKYRIKYFTIEKKSDEFGVHSGNLLIVI